GALDAVVIGAEAYVLRPYKIADVGDVVDHVIERGFARLDQERVAEVDPDDASGLGDGPDLVVGEVAGVVAKALCVAVRSVYGSARYSHHVPESGLRQVRDVDEH